MAGAAASGQTQQTPDEPVSCPADAMKPGEMTVQLMHDGVQRSFITFVPSTYDNTKPFPLLVNFHGAYQNSAQQRDFSRMNPVAEMKGFIVIYPQGSTSTNTWDAGDCCTQTEVDDVGFTRAAVKYMQEHVCIDKRRIYATGMSNGGRMTYRLGCEAADLFAAIAPVAGDKSFPDQKNSPGCMPARPISLIDFMGSADDGHFEYQQGQIKEWIGFNGCTDDQPKETYRNGMHACMTYSQCQAGTTVTYCIVQGGGHCWPGSSPCPLGDTSTEEELSANKLMWEVFDRSML
jgi:polyhydroxybutyrate depolymerase